MERQLKKVDFYRYDYCLG
uniref:Uncharacterized protein n=1 Tax=Anguilla anguilla TaxID=7936 RepID=A0A0E9ULJ0_ANGAN